MKDPYENVGVTADDVAPLIKEIYVTADTKIGLANAFIKVSCKNN